MGGLRLQLDVSALERLIGGDTELEIEIRQGIVQTFATKHLKGILDAGDFKNFLNAESLFVRENLAKAITEHIGSTKWSQGTYIYDMSPELLERLNLTLDVLVAEVIDTKIKELKATVEQTAQEIFDKNIGKLDALIDHKMSVLTDNYLNEKMTERMQAVIDALGAK